MQTRRVAIPGALDDDVSSMRSPFPVKPSLMTLIRAIRSDLQNFFSEDLSGKKLLAERSDKLLLCGFDLSGIARGEG